MPNHVTTHLTIMGPTADLDAIVTLMKGESAFDFNKLIPMPEPLRAVVTGARTVDGQTVREWLEVEKDGKRVAQAITPETLAAWRAQYGATNWYDWASKNWGTKWNAYDVGEWRPSKGRMSIDFTTAWADPKPVLAALIQRFPRITVDVAVDGEVDEPYSYGVFGDESPTAKRRQRRQRA